jgi:hypothetical protein
MPNSKTKTPYGATKHYLGMTWERLAAHNLRII